MHSIGKEIFDLVKILWPINRSITGDGVRKTLLEIQKYIPELVVHEVPSGTKVFDWIVPKEWCVNEAWIRCPSGERICEFSKNNLHLIGYSEGVHLKVSLEELNKHLYSLHDQPNAIPYVTSYYEKRWGFCIAHEERVKLKEGIYEIYIDAHHFNGSLTYGELLIKGRKDEEVFLSTYICHPSMANNELSGPAVTTFLAKNLMNLSDIKYSYRIVFIPETIGSITYLSQNLAEMKKNIIAGFNVTCVGDERAYSFLPSRNGKTLSDKIARHVLKNIDRNFISYNWSDRGSDERQYCSPGIDLPISTIMRSKYGEYDEYHTSLDNLGGVVTPSGLGGGYLALTQALQAIEINFYPKVINLGEPNLGERGLYPTLSTKNKNLEVKLMMDLITWADGTKDLLEIAEIIGVSILKLYPIAKTLKEKNVIEIIEYDFLKNENIYK